MGFPNVSESFILPRILTLLRHECIRRKLPVPPAQTDSIVTLIVLLNRLCTNIRGYFEYQRDGIEAVELILQKSGLLVPSGKMISELTQKMADLSVNASIRDQSHEDKDNNNDGDDDNVAFQQSMTAEAAIQATPHIPKSLPYIKSTQNTNEENQIVLIERSDRNIAVQMQVPLIYSIQAYLNDFIQEYDINRLIMVMNDDQFAAAFQITLNYINSTNKSAKFLMSPIDSMERGKMYHTFFESVWTYYNGYNTSYNTGGNSTFDMSFFRKAFVDVLIDKETKIDEAPYLPSSYHFQHFYNFMAVLRPDIVDPEFEAHIQNPYVLRGDEDHKGQLKIIPDLVYASRLPQYANSSNINLSWNIVDYKTGNEESFSFKQIFSYSHLTGVDSLISLVFTNSAHFINFRVLYLAQHQLESGSLHPTAFTCKLHCEYGSVIGRADSSKALKVTGNYDLLLCYPLSSISKPSNVIYDENYHVPTISMIPGERKFWELPSFGQPQVPDENGYSFSELGVFVIDHKPDQTTHKLRLKKALVSHKYSHIANRFGLWH